VTLDVASEKLRKTPTSIASKLVRLGVFKDRSSVNVENEKRGGNSIAALGLLWTSRQDEAARAVALFGDQLPESAFKVEVDRKPLCEDEHLDALLELAEQLFGL